jgi:hypothetical protein
MKFMLEVNCFTGNNVSRVIKKNYDTASLATEAFNKADIYYSEKNEDPLLIMRDQRGMMILNKRLEKK